MTRVEVRSARGLKIAARERDGGMWVNDVVLVRIIVVEEPLVSWPP